MLQRRSALVSGLLVALYAATATGAVEPFSDADRTQPAGIAAVAGDTAATGEQIAKAKRKKNGAKRRKGKRSKGAAAPGATPAPKVAAPPPKPAPPKSCLPSGPCRVFATRAVFDGALGGLAGADAKCQAAAGAARLGGQWKAWLSCAKCGEGGAAIDARSRLKSAELRSIGGAMVAPGLPAMLDCKDECLASSIGTDETGKKFTDLDEPRVWTGTFGNGSGADRPNCLDWTTAEVAEDGEVGLVDKRDEDWTSRSPLTSCSTTARLYCFEQ